MREDKGDPRGTVYVIEGTGADRQLDVWKKTHDIRAVVDYICDETVEGL